MTAIIVAAVPGSQSGTEKETSGETITIFDVGGVGLGLAGL
jgi:hypothetical protein